MCLQPKRLLALLRRGSDCRPGTNDDRLLFALHDATENLTRQAPAPAQDWKENSRVSQISQLSRQAGSGTAISKLEKRGAFLAGRAEGLPELQGHA
eukprot:COSAG06_NODE_22037_length_736_cov_2.271586_1_plen_95_part_10